MEKRLSQRIKEQLASLRSRKKWQALAGVLSLLVLCWTVYALILPAVATTDTYTSLNGTTPTVSATKQGTETPGTVYDATTGNYKSDLKLTWTLNRDSVVADDTYKYSYTYPSNIIVPDDLLYDGTDAKKYTLKDENNNAVGTYYFVKNEDGTYELYMDLEETTVEGLNGDFNVYVGFSGEIGSNAVQDDGSIVVTFKDSVMLTIDPSQIEYPDDETLHYDVSVSKKGSYTADGKLVYKVTVISYKGTPDPLDLTDVLTATGTTVDGMFSTLESVTVKSGTVKTYDNADWKNETTIENEATQLTAADSTDALSAGTYYYDRKGNLSVRLGKLAGVDNGATKTDSDRYTYRDGTCYELTYTFDMSNLPVGAAYAVNNSVAVKATDAETKETVSGTASKDVTIDKDYKISKYGSTGSAAGKIKWTITVNSNGQNIAGTTLTDTMLGELDRAAIEINPTGGYEVTTDSDGKVTKIDFSATDGTDTEINTNTYTITYETDIPSDATDWDGGTVSNTATWTNGSGTTIGSATGTYTVSGGGVAKEMTGTGTYNAEANTLPVSWKSTITLPTSGLASGTVITDDMLHDQWNDTLGTYQYMTAEQIKSIAITRTDASGNSMGTLDTSYYKLRLYEGTADGSSETYVEYDPANPTELDSTATYTKYEVVLKEALSYDTAPKLVLTYTTTADISAANTEKTGAQSYYKNMLQVGDKKESASYTYKDGKVIKTDGNGVSGTSTTVSADGTLTWKVSTTTDNLQSYSYLTVTDILPDSLTLTSLSYSDTVSYANTTLTIAENASEDGTYAVSGTCGSYTISGTYNTSTRKIELTIKNTDETQPVAQDQTFTITYNCKVSDKVLEAGTATEYTNKATVTTYKGEYGSSEQTQTWQKEETSSQSKDLQKSATYYKDDELMKYQLVINPDEKDLLEGSNTLQLEDVLDYWPDTEDGVNRDYELVQSSVKLYYAKKADDGTYEKDGEVEDWTWIVSEGVGANTSHVTKTIKADIPDSTALILEYSYAVDMTKPANWDDVKLLVSNTATISGTKIKSEKSNENDKWQESQTSGGLTGDRAFTVYKVAKGSYGTVLSGAVFTVQKYDASTGAFVDTEKTYTTNASGTFSVTKEDTDDSGNTVYDEDTLYRLVETKAPEGYKLNESASYCYFYFDSDASYTLPMIDGTTCTATNLSTSTKTEYIENEKRPEEETTTVSVGKKWFDKNSTPINGSDDSLPESIEITLYRSGYSVDANGTKTTLAQETVGTYTVMKDNSWMWSSKNEEDLASGLPTVTTDDNDVTYYYTYSVEETEVDGYTSKVTTEGTTAFTISNTEDSRTEEKMPITVNKKWFDTDGETELTPGDDQTITFNLYQVKEEADEDATGVTLEQYYLNGDSAYSTETLALDDYPVGATVRATFHQANYDDNYMKLMTAESVVNGETTELSVVSEKEEVANSWGTSTNYDFTIEFVVQANMTIKVHASSANNEWSYDSPVVVSTRTDGKLVKTVKLSSDNDWSYTFTDLPKSATVTTSDGTTTTKYVYTYYVQEKSVDGYSTTYQYGSDTTAYTNTVNGSLSDGTVTIKNTKKKGLAIEKVWQNAEGTTVTSSAPSSISYTVYQIATVKPETVTVTLMLRSDEWRTEEVSKGESYKLKIKYTKTSEGEVVPELRDSNWNLMQDDSPSLDTTDGTTYGSYTVTYTLGEISTETKYYYNEGTSSQYEFISLTSTSEDSDTTSSTETAYRTGTLTAANNWKTLITDLPTEGTERIDGAETEVTYTYKVVEDGSYTVTYSLTPDGGTDATETNEINDKTATNTGSGYAGTLIITNKVDESEVYTLPNTGGRGTLLYIVGGTALASAALLALAYKNKKKQRGGRMAH